MDLSNAPHTLILPIDTDAWSLPSQGVVVDGIAFAAKTELHITLIGSRLGRELYTTLAPEFLRDQLDQAFAAQDWEFSRSGRLVLLTRRAQMATTTQAVAPTRRSIIELVELPAMRPFHQTLGRLLGRQLSVPPAHVTLYTAGDPRGIGLPDPARLRALGRALQQPI